MNNIVVIAGLIIAVVMMVPVVLKLKDHPRGLFILFFAEMWERFSYYGMRAILVFYLTQHFLFTDKQAGALYGSYTALVYLMPLVGGFLADRLLGSRKAIAFGALLLVLGQGAMAIQGPSGKTGIEYQGKTYEFVNEGRGSKFSAKVVVDQKPYEFAANKDGNIEIKNLPANASLPSVLKKGDYKIPDAKRDAFFEGLLYFALSLIIMGVGYLKANISAIVGQLYPQGDKRRDGGFSLFYFGINMGSFLSSIGCSMVGEAYGWNWGFGLAGAGMLLGFLVFVWGKPMLEGKGEPPQPEELKKPFFGPINKEWAVYLLSFVGVAPIIYLLPQQSWVTGLELAIAAAALAYILFNTFTKYGKIERERILLALVLIMGSICFWALFEQAGSSLNLFAARNTNLHLVAQPFVTELFGQKWVFAEKEQLAALGLADGSYTFIDMSFKASQAQAFNAGFILLFAPIFAGLWASLDKIKANPNPVTKFGFALLLAGGGFMFLVWSAVFADADYRVPLMFLAITYMIHTWGELSLSPVGLSQITKLSPSMIVSTMMAMWFMATSLGQMVGGYIAAAAGTETIGGQVLDPKAAFDGVLAIFKLIGGVGVGFGALYLVIAPFIKGWSHGADGTVEEVKSEQA